MSFSEEQLAEINKMVGSAISSTFAADSDVMKTLQASNAAQLKAQLGSLDIAGQITTAMEGFKPKADESGGDGGDGGDGGGDEASPAMLKMKAQMEKLTREAQEATTRAESEAASRKADRLFQAFRDSAAKAGVPADRIGAMLNHAKGLGIVKYDANDKPGLAFTKQWGEEIVAMGAEDMGAMKTFLDTPDGKIFLPPRGVHGTGEGGNRGGGGGGQDAPKYVRSDGTLDEKAMGNAIMKQLAQISNQ